MTLASRIVTRRCRLPYVSNVDLWFCVLSVEYHLYIRLSPCRDRVWVHLTCEGFRVSGRELCLLCIRFNAFCVFANIVVTSHLLSSSAQLFSVCLPRYRKNHVFSEYDLCWRCSIKRGMLRRSYCECATGQKFCP